MLRYATSGSPGVNSIMRIAHVNLARGFRGGERQAELLVKSLGEFDVQQVVIARRGGALAKRLRDLDIDVRQCDGFVSAYRAMRDIDVVHVHEGRSVYIAWLRHEVSNTPYVITRRVNNPLGRSWLTHRAYRRASAVASVAADVARIVQAFDSRINSCVIHSSSSGLTADPAAVAAIRGAHPGKWLVGNVGALQVAQKAQDVIIEVARRIERSHPDIVFVLVGSGEDEAMLRELADGVSNVVFAGWSDNVGDYLAAFDLFVLPSYKEGIGGILLDAMDQSLPVVATRVGGLPEIVRDGDNGLLIDAGSPDQLQAAVLHLHADPELCRAMGERGHDFARGFTAAQMAAEYMRLYRQAIE